MAKKLSVYIPDELWQRAVRLDRPKKGEKPNASALVQRALELMVREHDRQTQVLSAGANLDPERFGSVLASVRAGAQAEFNRGYACGLELVEEIGFEGLQQIEIDYLGELEFWLPMVGPVVAGPGEAWREKYRDEFPQGDDGLFDCENLSHPIFYRGAVRALDDLWKALRVDMSAGDDARRLDAPGEADQAHEA